MNRRDALAAVTALFGTTIVGSSSFLAGCASPDASQQGFDGLLSAEEMNLLDEVGETILPETADSPGAKAARIGMFMNVIVTDCYSPEHQVVFQTGLQQLESKVGEQHGLSFLSLAPEQRHTFLLELEAETDSYDSLRGPDDPEVHYYRMIKELTLWGYFSSEIGATQALRYIPVPGRYEGCIPYEEGAKAWAR